MPRASRAFCAGLLTSLLGIVVSVLPVGLHFEEDTGLALLFRSRGIRTPPQEVLIVTMDRLSSRNLDLSTDPQEWPRSLHAHLVDTLSEKGASVIVFDIHFEEQRSDIDDSLLADAIRRAGNIILCQVIKSDVVPVKNEKGVTAGYCVMQRLVSPSACLSDAALAMAPFPLPKIPVKVSQYWTFKTSAGDTPTLPVVAFQVFALREQTLFRQILTSAYPEIIKAFPLAREPVMVNRGPEKLIANLRTIFRERPSVADELMETLGPATGQARAPTMDRALIRMYQSPDSLYLNFYGPPGTITTIPYYQALHANKDPMSVDFQGKIIFVGLSEQMRPEQKDGFYTVFSESSGVDMSGVEIAATAFANLLEQMPLQPLDLWKQLLILFLWGMVLSVVCRLLPASPAGFAVIAMGLLYFLAARYEFSTRALWFPLTIPLFLQAPFAFFFTILWKYFEGSKERKAMRKAMGYYLPDWMVDEVSRNIADMKASNRMVYGTCLFTDAAQYTSLSEKMAPEELAGHMGRYYEAVFGPVKDHGGTVINIVGDSMLALWETSKPDPLPRKRACLAALDISYAVTLFNRANHALHLRTRIGLHSGHILLGNVGAAHHFEYRPVGDIVNTASRMEGLNKFLGTGILVSEEVLETLEGLVTRHLGEFQFAGKRSPVSVYELIGRTEESNAEVERLCTMFAEALAAYRSRSWEEAERKFSEIIRTRQGDGPSFFYLDLCRRYRATSPGQDWNGIVCLNEK